MIVLPERQRRAKRDIDGILLFDKPLGLSSNAALQQVRHLYGAAKAGHAGSLDPLATGLLPLCFGQATKVCGQLLESSKTYRVSVRLGERTVSGDCETPVCETAPVPALDRASVEQVLAGFMGEQQQIPPMHSALKVGGQRLYGIARRGESVERAARTIVISDIRLLQLEPAQLDIEVHCSKGTYIRSLAEDLAREFGTVGHVRGLRRVGIAAFDGEAAGPSTGPSMITIETLTARREQGEDALLSLLLAPDSVFSALPRLNLDATAERALLQGQAFAYDGAPEAATLRAYNAAGQFLGVVSQAAGKVRPKRLFVDTNSLNPRAV